MTFVFFYSALDLGGIETLILRLSNWLIIQGHQVTLVLVRDGALDHLLNPSVQRIYVRSRMRAMLPLGGVRKALPTSVSAVCAFDPESLCLAGSLFAGSKIDASFYVGVYHPRIYFFSQYETRLQRVVKQLFIASVPENSIVFMNESCRISHAEGLRHDFSQSHILPLALSPVHSRVEKITPFKIISVGRLVAFKTYNLYMIEVLRDLISRGFTHTTWHVYGDGPLEEDMRALVREHGLGHHVFLHGPVEYSKMQDSIRDAQLFVGMGTALVEAGLMGIPGVIAVDSESARTYGYTYELEGYDVGENTGKFPGKFVCDLVADIFLLDADRYVRECEKTRRHCERFLVNNIGVDFLSLIPRLGTTGDFYRRGATPRLWLHYLLVLPDELLKKFHDTFVAVVKAVLPRRLQSLPRRINRWLLARRKWEQLKKGTTAFPSKESR